MIRRFTFFLAILFLVTKVSSTKLDASSKHCTDPRTLLKHAANTEWADTYSCTRHRCQPGGRTLAIYTVGCKRVEPPESAIECEEVVEDTNMQFPFCCTRLRCLVVIHGEVWTKVLGQPWETLPAAPWSHMYKVKKPPPADALQYKNLGAHGNYNNDVDNIDDKFNFPLENTHRDLSPVFNAEDKLVNAAESSFIESISGKHHKKVINANVKPHTTPMKIHQRSHDSDSEKDVEDPADEESRLEAAEAEMEEAEPVVEHKNSVWAESSPKWVEDPSPDDASIIRRATKPKSLDFSHEIDKKKVKASTLQVLVDAIGSRMRDIEDVVQRMSSKVASEKEEHFESAEKKGSNDKEEDENIKEIAPTKKPRSNSNSHRRFDSNGDTTFVRTTDYTTEQNLYANERGGIGFINEDVETPLIRRSANPKEPIRPTYMAPVDMRRKSVPPQLGVEHLGDNSDEHQMKHRKHKRKHSHRKKHHKESKRRKSDDESQEPSSKEDENVLDKKR